MLKNYPYLQSLSNLLRKKAVFIFVVFLWASWLLFTGIIFKSILYLALLFFATVILQFLFLIEKSYFIYLVRACLVIGICFEAFFGKLNKNLEAKEATEILDRFTVNDPKLGFKFSENVCAAKAMLIYGDDTIYNVTYSSDAYGRRIISTDTAHKSKHAIFLGCSYTFGHGLPERETIPFMFEKMRPTYESFNYGYEAYGPNQMAWQFSPSSNLINKNNIPQDSGIALYTYIDDHLCRVYGGSFYLQYCPTTPEVYIRNDSLVIARRSKMQLLKAKVFNKIQTLKYFDFNSYYPDSDEFYKRFADILNYSARQYYQKFKGKFYVGIYPGNSVLRWTKWLDASITLVKVPPPPDFKSNQKKYFISPKFDQHPSVFLNRYYVNYISKFINQ